MSVSNPHPSSPLDAEIDKVLETLHQKVAIDWIKNDGQPHQMQSHANGDNCVKEARTALQSLIHKHDAELEFYRGLYVEQSNLGGTYKVTAKQLWNELQNRKASLTAQLGETV